MIQYASTDLLQLAFRQEGPAYGPVLLLLHGWPDDATTWDDVVPYLTAAGYRVVVPWLWGFGETCFLQENTLRTGNPGWLVTSFRHAQLQWYHWFWATAVGEKAVRNDPEGFARIQGENWSPAGWFTGVLRPVCAG